MTSKLAYLQQMYGAQVPSGDGTSQKKKKAKRKLPPSASSTTRMRIHDADVDWKEIAPAKPTDLADIEGEDDKPTIVKELGPGKQGGLKQKIIAGSWETVGDHGEEVVQLQGARTHRARSASSDASPPRRERQRHDSESDVSPPRRRTQRHDSESDTSPPRRGQQGGESPPSRNGRRRHDSDASPPRRAQRQRHDSDASPPRKTQRQRHDSDSDVSLPRKSKQRYDSDARPSPPRRPKAGRVNDSDVSPVRRSRHDSDASPVRRSRHDSDASPPRKSKHLSRRRHDSDSDEVGTVRKASKRSNSTQNTGAGALEGNPETVYRDAKGRKLDMLTEMMKQRDILEGKAKKEAEEQFEWGTGIVQKQEMRDKHKELEELKEQPFARYADDAHLDKMQRDRLLPDDPMFEYAQKRRQEQTGKPLRPVYKGPPAPPNRFGILPGHRWDGIVRGNNWERKVIEKSASKTARTEEAYSWSVQDM